MNPQRTTLILLSVAAFGIGACGGSSDTADRVQERTEQIHEDAAQRRQDQRR